MTIFSQTMSEAKHLGWGIAQTLRPEYIGTQARPEVETLDYVRGDNEKASPHLRPLAQPVPRWYISHQTSQVL